MLFSVSLLQLMVVAVWPASWSRSGESLPLTLPRGYAKIILEYAGNEDTFATAKCCDEVDSSWHFKCHY